MLVICKQVILGFCHYLVVVLLKIWPLVVAGWQSSSLVKALVVLPEIEPLQQGISGLCHSSFCGTYFSSFCVVLFRQTLGKCCLKYRSMWQQRHCSIVFGQLGAFQITWKICYYRPGFTLVVSLKWPETLEWQVLAHSCIHNSKPLCLGEVVWVSSRMDHAARSQLCFEIWSF